MFRKCIKSTMMMKIRAILHFFISLNLNIKTFALKRFFLISKLKK